MRYEKFIIRIVTHVIINTLSRTCLVGNRLIKCNKLTCSTKSHIFVISIRTIGCSVAQVLNRYAISIARTPERLVWMTGICKIENKTFEIHMKIAWREMELLFVTHLHPDYQLLNEHIYVSQNNNSLNYAKYTRTLKFIPNSLYPKLTMLWNGDKFHVSVVKNVCRYFVCVLWRIKSLTSPFHTVL